MQKLKITLLITNLIAFGSFAQQALTTSGGTVSGSGGNLSYTIGQIDYTAVNNSEGSLLQGVQQPYEIFTLSTTENFSNLSVSVYPNPTSDLLMISIEESKITDLEYTVIDQQGKSIKSNKISSSNTIIYFEEMANGIYYIVITSQEKSVHTIKIIKNQ